MDGFLWWGLAAAVTWGTADFCAKKAAVKLGFWPTVWGMNAVGAVALGSAWAAGAIPIAPAQLRPLLGLGAGNTLGGVLFYYALEFGPLVLVSPITAAYPVVSTLLAFWIRGERLGPALGAAVGAVIAGTLLASLGHQNPATAPAQLNARPHARYHSALAAAMLSALVFGAVFYGLASASQAAATGWGAAAAPALMFRLAGTVLLALPLLWGARPPAAMLRSPWLWATGLLDSSAYLLYCGGARHLPISVVSSLSGLFSVWTLILAVIFLRERLAGRQWLGVALIFMGVALLAWG